MAYLEECVYAGFVFFSLSKPKVSKNYANHIQWLGKKTIFFRKLWPCRYFFEEKKNCVFLTPQAKGVHISNNKLYFNNKTQTRHSF